MICVADGIMVPLAEGEEPAAGADSFAEQAAVAPPLLPLQLHAHGPLPVTVDGLPVVQRPAVGEVVRATPLALPQMPVTGGVNTMRGSLPATHALPFHDDQLPALVFW
jgi:hypothetical protein